jgi:thioredoxin reductase (NADPH)
LVGEERLEKIQVAGPGGEETIECDGVFIFIGAEPHTAWLGDAILRDDKGFIVTGADVLEHPRGKEVWPLKRPPMLLETSMPGVFAAGDVRSGSVKRVASSVGQGSIAVQLVHEFLREVKA